jgi:ElaB/YqjD/DUF883 family membrane-anchored ribosome-binding protein
MTMSFTADDAQAQIASLRKQVNQLMDERVSPAISDFADRAQKVTRQASEYGKQASDYTRDQAGVVAEQVRGSPLIAIALAGAVGYVLGRFVR